MSPPHWLGAATSTVWACCTAAALAASLASPRLRRSAWPWSWGALLVLATWWANLNVQRWAGWLSHPNYRDAVAPIVPVLLAVLAANAALFAVRAGVLRRRDDVIASIVEETVATVTDSDDRRYTGGP